MDFVLSWFDTLLTVSYTRWRAAAVAVVQYVPGYGIRVRVKLSIQNIRVLLDTPSCRLIQIGFETS